MVKIKAALNANTLKAIALIVMIFNHFCVAYCSNVSNEAYFFTDAHWYLTRLSFVLYAFFITEGMTHTHDRKKYMLRLFLFALISEIPYNLFQACTVIRLGSTNVFFTLFLGAAAIYFIDLLSGKYLLQFLAFAVCCYAALKLGTDYSYFGVSLIVTFYIFRGNRKKQLICSAILFCILTYGYYSMRYVLAMPLSQVIQHISTINYYAFMEMHGLLAFPLLALYNGERGSSRYKMLFYASYPIHLVLVWLITDVVI